MSGETQDEFVAKLQQEVAQLKEEVKRGVKEREVLEKDVEQLCMQNAQTGRGADSRVSSVLQERLTAVRAELRDSQGKLEEALQEKEDLQTAQLELRNSSRKVEKGWAEEVKVAEKLRSDVAFYMAKAASVLNDSNKLVEEIEALKDREKQYLDKEETESSRSAAIASSLQQECDALKEHVRQVDRELNEQTAMQAHLRAECDQAMQQHHSAQAQLESVGGELAAKAGAVARLEQTVADLQSTQLELAGECNAMTDKLAAEKQGRLRAEAEVREMEAQVARLKVAAEEHESAAARARADAAAAAEKARAQLQDLQESAEKKLKEAVVEQLAQQRKATEKDMEVYNEQLEKLEVENSQMRDQLVQASREKVEALLALSQTEVAEVRGAGMDGRAAAALQGKLGEVSKALQQVTDEKVEALRVLAESKKAESAWRREEKKLRQQIATFTAAGARFTWFGRKVAPPTPSRASPPAEGEASTSTEGGAHQRRLSTSDPVVGELNVDKAALSGRLHQLQCLATSICRMRNALQKVEEECGDEAGGLEALEAAHKWVQDELLMLKLAFAPSLKSRSRAFPSTPGEEPLPPSTPSSCGVASPASTPGAAGPSSGLTSFPTTPLQGEGADSDDVVVEELMDLLSFGLQMQRDKRTLINDNGSFKFRVPA